MPREPQHIVLYDTSKYYGVGRGGGGGGESLPRARFSGGGGEILCRGELYATTPVDMSVNIMRGLLLHINRATYTQENIWMMALLQPHLPLLKDFTNIVKTVSFNFKVR